MNAGQTSAPDERRAPADTPAEAGGQSLRARLRPLPADAGDDAFLPFVDLCFNWSMDRPRIERAELLEREDAAFYFKDWGRDGDIAVAAHADVDPDSAIIGLAWVRVADIEDVIGDTEPDVPDDFAAALRGAGVEVIRSEVVPETAAEGALTEESAEESAEDASAEPVTLGSGEGRPFTGYGWVAADIPELSIAVLPEHQGQGIGGALLDAVCSLVRMSGFPAVSLSVEDGNGAARLYAAHGFDAVGRHGDSDVLVRRLIRH